MSRTARLIITFECERGCTYCCNRYTRIMSQAKRIPDVSPLRGFDIVCITGGEPMLSPDKTLAVIRDIRRECNGAAVYLYTALLAEAMPEVLDAVDGVHFTLHDGATEGDISDFHNLQDMLEGRDGSYRLYVNPSVRWPVAVKPHLWKRIEVKQWMSEQQLLDMQPGGLPIDEEMFILEPGV